MILLIFAADTQKCNKGSIKKASRFFLDFSFCICICMVYEVEANTGINTSGESALIT